MKKEESDAECFIPFFFEQRKRRLRGSHVATRGAILVAEIKRSPPFVLFLGATSFLPRPG